MYIYFDTEIYKKTLFFFLLGDTSAVDPYPFILKSSKFIITVFSVHTATCKYMLIVSFTYLIAIRLNSENHPCSRRIAAIETNAPVNEHTKQGFADLQ